MKNKKGFVMTETLVVTVFLVSIFTFIYVSIVPLLGKYEDMINRNANIDIVYKLYHIREMIKNDDNYENITSNSFISFTCSDLSDRNYCNKLMEYLEIDNYLLIYADSISNRLTNFEVIPTDTNNEIYNYIKKYQDTEGEVLVLFDKDTHVIAHLLMI